MGRARARARQVELDLRRHGGKRRGAGRKPTLDRATVSHGRRRRLSGREPVLVTMKVRRHVWNLRSRRVLERLLPSLAAAGHRLGVRLVHFSIQGDHIHLIVEAESAKALASAMGGLAVRIARRLNKLMGRRGKVFADRYHSRVLDTPRAVRTALAYVLCNFRKHNVSAGPLELDPFSSARWFDGWRGMAAEPSGITATPQTWLLSVGWRRAGPPLDPAHRPGPWQR